MLVLQTHQVTPQPSSGHGAYIPSADDCLELVAAVVDQDRAAPGGSRPATTVPPSTTRTPGPHVLKNDASWRPLPRKLG